MEDKNEQVISQYDIKINNVYKQKGTIILETQEGLKILKSYAYSEKRACFENEIKNSIIQKGYKNTDLFYKNKKGVYITQNRYGNKIILKDHFLGDECNIKDVKSIELATVNLANIHGILKNIEVNDELKDMLCIKNIKTEFDNYNKEIKRINKYIHTKKKKNQLEVNFLKYIEKYYVQGLKAAEDLQKSNYEKYLKDAVNNNKMCHGSYNQHNIIIDNNIVYTTNFEKSVISVQIYDLYCFIRKVMEKNSWDIDLGIMIISIYDKQNNISKDELNILIIMLSFPEKFRKLLNSYYNTRKTWISSRITEKLDMITSQEKYREKFLNKISSDYCQN